MIDHIADSLITANVRARISAFIEQASLILRAVAINNAIRPASGVRIAFVFRDASAKTISTYRIRTTGRRLARIA